MRNKIIRVYFTTSEESRFLAWKYLKKHECKHICFPLYFPNMFSGIIYWLRWIRSMCVVFVHYNKIKNQQRCSFYLIPVLQYLIGLLFPLYCQAKNGLFRLKLINKKVAISFCPTFVQSLVLHVFSRKFHQVARLPSPCARLQFTTQSSHQKKECYLSGFELKRFQNSVWEISYSVTVSKVSHSTIMIKGICL